LLFPLLERKARAEKRERRRGKDEKGGALKEGSKRRGLAGTSRELEITIVVSS
jgi:hypothetical protein